NCPRAIPSGETATNASSSAQITNGLESCFALNDAMLTTPVRGSATVICRPLYVSPPRSSREHVEYLTNDLLSRRSGRLAGPLRRPASRSLHERASIGLGQTRVPANAPVSIHRANERRLPRLGQRSHCAACLRRR